MTVQFIKDLDDVEGVRKHLISIYESKNTHFLVRSGLIKFWFKPHLDEYEISNAWFNDMKKGEILRPHKDMETSTSFVFYIKSTGDSPLDVEGKQYFVKSGDLVKYDSHALHGVPAVNEDHRLSLVIEAGKGLRKGIDYERYM